MRQRGRGWLGALFSGKFQRTFERELNLSRELIAGDTAAAVSRLMVESVKLRWSHAPLRS